MSSSLRIRISTWLLLCFPSPTRAVHTFGIDDLADLDNTWPDVKVYCIMSIPSQDADRRLEDQFWLVAIGCLGKASIMRERTCHLLATEGRACRRIHFPFQRQAHIHHLPLHLYLSSSWVYIHQEFLGMRTQKRLRSQLTMVLFTGTEHGIPWHLTCSSSRRCQVSCPPVL